MSFSIRTSACGVGLVQRALVRPARTSHGSGCLNKNIFMSMSLRRPFHLTSLNRCSPNSYQVGVNADVVCNSAEKLPDTTDAIDTEIKGGIWSKNQSVSSSFQEKKITVRLATMRTRLREKHGLRDDVLKPSKEPSHKQDCEIINNDAHLQRISDDIFNSNVEDNIADGSQHEEVSRENLQSEFIQSLRETNSSSQQSGKREAFVSAPFGLLRLDNMNNPKRPLNAQKPFVEKQRVAESKESMVNPSSKSTKSRNIEEGTFRRNKSIEVSKSCTTESNVTANTRAKGINIFDEQYFMGAADQTWNKTLEKHWKDDDGQPTPDVSDQTLMASQLMSKDESLIEKIRLNEETRDDSLSLQESLKLTKLSGIDESKYCNNSVNLDQSMKQDPSKQSSAISYSLNEVDKNDRSKKVASQKYDSETVSEKYDSENLFEDQYFNQSTPATEKIILNSRKPELVFPMNQKPNTASTSSKKSSTYFHSEFVNRSNTEEETEFHEPTRAAWEKRRNVRPVANIEHPSTAYDFALKIRLESKTNQTKLDAKNSNVDLSSRRKEASSTTSSHNVTGDVTTSGQGSMPRENKWSGPVDSKGFRILTTQIVDVQRLTQDDLVGYLKDSVIYEDENLLAIDKPYGLPSHGGPGVHHSVGKLLQPLAARMKKGDDVCDLHLVHRLDKETTGVMVLAKSQQIYELLLAMFKKRQVTKRYWLITKGIPDPVEGVIDIPMGEGTVGDRYRMELRPNYTSETRQVLKVVASGGGPALDAVTNYRVLDSASSAALVECTPETGVKHQIRCHMSFALNTPILGDHKYSHFTKMVPQRLHPEMLQRLGIRQSKVRHVPMHLHAKALVLPEFKNGRNLFLSARLPKHFVQNMKWLKLTPPS